MTIGSFLPRKIYLIAIGVVGVAVVLFGLVGPPQLLARSEAPDFCGGCHVMKGEFEAFEHTGAHRRKLCVDCHLPNQNMALHYAWKSLDGAKDLVLFYTGLVPEQVKLSPRSTEVLQ